MNTGDEELRVMRLKEFNFARIGKRIRSLSELSESKLKNVVEMFSLGRDVGGET